METSKDNLRALPLAVVGLAVALVDVCVIQEFKHFKTNHDFLKLITREPQPWQAEFFGDNDGTVDK